MTMRKNIRPALLATCLLGAGIGFALPAGAQSAAATDSAAAIAAPLQAAVAGAWRSSANKARDVWRHPAQTLAFFGVQPQHTVIEITPGGGWYAEILAPYLRAAGRYIAAVPDGASLEKKFAAQPQQFDRARIQTYDPAQPVFGAPASADVVLTFRNVHNWRFAGREEAMFRGFFAVLKPGGTLGVVEHRAQGDLPASDRSGYVGQAQVIALAEAAGFRLAASSEINANPRDTKDHPQGVWMLPPTNKHEAADAQRFAAMGESDRMTLRFVKPE